MLLDGIDHQSVFVITVPNPKLVASISRLVKVSKSQNRGLETNFFKCLKGILGLCHECYWLTLLTITFPRQMFVQGLWYMCKPLDELLIVSHQAQERLRFLCKFMTEWILSQLSSSLCWFSPILWRHDEPDSLSHPGRICTLWVLASGCAPRSDHTQHASITCAPPLSSRTLSCHLSRWSSTLSSALLGSSALISETWLGHCTAQMVYILFKKKSRFPHSKSSILLQCFIYCYLPKTHLQVQAGEVSCSH